VSRIVSGKLRVDLRVLDLRPVLEAGLDSARAAAGAACTPDRRTEVEGDLVRVNQDDVMVTANTFLVNEAGDPISMADFKVGSVVRVKGTYNQDASAIDARRITLLE
jgi:hypothetical protein